MTQPGGRLRRIVSSGLCGPVVATLAFAFLLLSLLTTETLGVAPGAYGPLSWPLFSLVLLVAGCALLCVLRTRDFLGGRAPEHGEAGDAKPGDTRVALATALIALYGAGFVYVGYLFSTVTFMMAWLALVRYRRPVQAVLISVLGTVLPLYLLIKVVYMPLPRGVGPIEQATIHVYQWLRLF